MRLFSRLQIGLRARRHIAVAAGLLVLWVQVLAFAAPMPWMAPANADAAGNSPAAAILCLNSDDSGVRRSGDKPLPAGKMSQQCPVCQTLQILASSPAPRMATVEFLPVPLQRPQRPANDNPVAACPAAAGFLSRAPPTV